MEINEIPRGQLSTIILTTLLDGDKYGLEMIDEIEKKTFGELVIKKPSLYSSLSRMEKQDLVSSYWKDSDIGGRRHYYRLTDYGRKQVLQWQNELLTSKNKVSQILTKQEENATDEEGPTLLQQENLFALTKEKEELPENTKKTEKTVKPSTDFIQYDLFSANTYVATASESRKSAISEEPMVFNMKAFEQKQEEATQPVVVPQEAPQQPILPTVTAPKQEQKAEAKEVKMVQVKHHFDFESAYEKYVKSAASYAETFQAGKVAKNTDNMFGQGILNGQSFIETAFEPQNETIKNSSFAGQWDEPQMEVEEQPQKAEEPQNDMNSPHEEEKPHDDAVLITATPTQDQLPKVKKIAPATFNHNLVTPKYDLKKKVENENMSQQMEQKTTIAQEKLKDYFASRSIALRPYNKVLAPKLPETHDQPHVTGKPYIAINKFNMFKSLALFGAVGAQSLILLFVLKALGLFALSTLWMYILVPTVALAYFAFWLVVFLKNKTKQVEKQSQWQNPLWYKLIFISILLILIYAIHLLAGMNEFNYTNYLTTLLFPCILVLDYIGLHVANTIAFLKK